MTLTNPILTTSSSSRKNKDSRKKLVVSESVKAFQNSGNNLDKEGTVWARYIWWHHTTDDIYDVMLHEFYDVMLHEIYMSLF